MSNELAQAYAEAFDACGRHVEVEQVKDGSYIVVYLNAQTSPPPKAASELDALRAFTAYILKTPKELPDDDRTGHPATDHS